MYRGCTNLETEAAMEKNTKPKNRTTFESDPYKAKFWKILNQVCPLKCAYFKLPNN